MRKRDLERYERLLREERARLREQQEELEESVRRSIRDSSGDLSAYAFHMADLGTDAMEREQNMMLAASLSRTLEDIELALGKIAENRYGPCDNCGNPIDPKRLDALPYARFCMTCQENEDRAKSGGAGRP